MGDREARKSAWEVEQGTRVAEYLNGAQGTDYEARAADAEPSEVVLISPTGRFPARNAQVVSIPLDFRSRDDKQTVTKVQGQLSQLLRERGINEIYVGLSLSGEVEMHGMTRPQIVQLADLIAQKRGEQDVTLRYEDTYEQFPELAELVHTTFISCPGVFRGMQIDIPAGGAVPPDGFGEGPSQFARCGQRYCKHDSCKRHEKTPSRPAPATKSGSARHKRLRTRVELWGEKIPNLVRGCPNLGHEVTGDFGPVGANIIATASFVTR